MIMFFSEKDGIRIHAGPAQVDNLQLTNSSCMNNGPLGVNQDDGPPALQPTRSKE